jgi:hypothetical protein
MLHIQQYAATRTIGGFAMLTYIVFGLLIAGWAAVEVVATTLAVKDITAARRRAKVARTGFRWAAKR